MKRVRSAAEGNRRRLLLALGITGLMTVVEVAGGLLANSLALLGDAGHMFTDTLVQVSSALREIQGVRDVHDVHLWTITSGIYALSCHLLIEDRMVSESGPGLPPVGPALRRGRGGFPV